MSLLTVKGISYPQFVTEISRAPAGSRGIYKECLTNYDYRMYSAYFDESGTDGSSESTVVAGFFASDEQWQNFQRAGGKVLDDSVVSPFPIKDIPPHLPAFKDS